MIYGFPLVRAVLRSVQIGIPPVKSFMERLFGIPLVFTGEGISSVDVAISVLIT